MYPASILCGLALLTAQYFVGRGPYPFLPLPAYGVLCLAALAGLLGLARSGVAVPRWAAIGFAAALAAWLAVPLAGRADFWIDGAVIRLTLAGCVVYGLLVFVITGARERCTLIGVLLASVLLQALFGAFQYLAPSAQPHLGWISDLCPMRMEGHAFRARGFYYNANHLAWLLNFGGAFALAIGVWGRTGIWMRILLLYLAAMFFGSVILTQSRGGLLGAAAAMLVFFLVSCRALFHGAWGRRGRVFTMVVVALAVCLGAAWQVYSASDLAQFRVSKVGEETYRAAVWKTALRHWQVSPLEGGGAGTFSDASRFYRFRTEALDDIFAHNDWVQSLAEFGLIGTGLGLCVVLLHLASGWRAFGVDLRQRMAMGSQPVSMKAALQLGGMSSLAAFGVHAFFDFNLQIPANALLVCVSLGILAAPAQRWIEGGVYQAALRLCPVIVAIGGIVLGLLSWKCQRAELAWIRADNELNASEFASSLKLAEAGLKANPRHTGLLDTGGRAALTLGRASEPEGAAAVELVERATSLFAKAREIEPRDAWHSINLGHAFDSKGDFSSARAALLEGIRWAPNYATPYEFYGLHLENAGEKRDALRVYGLALAFPETIFAAEKAKAIKESGDE